MVASDAHRAPSFDHSNETKTRKHLEAGPISPCAIELEQGRCRPPPLVTSRHASCTSPSPRCLSGSARRATPALELPCNSGTRQPAIAERDGETPRVRVRVRGMKLRPEGAVRVSAYGPGHSV